MIGDILNNLKSNEKVFLLNCGCVLWCHAAIYVNQEGTAHVHLLNVFSFIHLFQIQKDYESPRISINRNRIDVLHQLY